jgi:hypothetical protein
MLAKGSVAREDIWNLSDRLKIVSNASLPVSKENLFDGTGIDEADREKVIHAMEKNEELKETEDGLYQASICTFSDFVKSSNLKDTRKKLLMLRIDGASLKEIARDSGVTRENVRICERIALTRAILAEPFSHGAHEPLYDKRVFVDHFYMPFLNNVKLEDKFRTYLEKHDPAFLSAEYFYMRLFPNKTKNIKKKSLFDYVSGRVKQIPDTIMKCLIKFYHPVFTDDGCVFKDYNGDFFVNLLKRYPSLKITTLYDLYESKEHVIEPFSKESCKKSSSYFFYIFTLNRNVIHCGSGRIRYYDIDKYKKKIPDVMSKLIISKTGKMAADVIFDENKDLLSEIDIHNGYELHAIMRKANVIPSSITLGKMPILFIDPPLENSVGKKLD